MPELTARDVDRLDWVLGRIAAFESTIPFAELSATRIQPTTDLTSEGAAAGLINSGQISYVHLRNGHRQSAEIGFSPAAPASRRRPQNAPRN